MEKDDKEYPEWLFALKSRRATLEDLVERVNKVRFVFCFMWDILVEKGSSYMLKEVWMQLQKMFRGQSCEGCLGLQIFEG